MPTYVYRCGRCDGRENIVKPMVDSDKSEECSDCGTPMYKDIAANMPMARKDYYSKAIHSDALAINPNQVREHQQLYPDVKLDRECRPILDSYVKHDEYIEARGVHKPQGRSRRKTRRIA